MQSQTLYRRKSRIGREWTAIAAVMMREIVLWLMTPFMWISGLGMPLIMMGMIGGNVMGMGDADALGPAMLIGMMVNMCFMNTAMGMSSLVADRDTDFNQEMLVAPVSRYSLVIGKILGASFSAIVSMFGTVIVGLVMDISLPFDRLLLIVALSPLMCFAGGALSMLIIGFVRNTRAVQPAISFITMPQMFLSGAIIPINESSPVLVALSRVMPMTYAVDLARAVAGVGEPRFDTWLNFSAIAMITLICLMIGTFFFARSEKYR